MQQLAASVGASFWKILSPSASSPGSSAFRALIIERRRRDVDSTLPTQQNPTPPNGATRDVPRRTGREEGRRGPEGRLAGRRDWDMVSLWSRYPRPAGRHEVGQGTRLSGSSLRRPAVSLPCGQLGAAFDGSFLSSGVDWVDGETRRRWRAAPRLTNNDVNNRNPSPGWPLHHFHRQRLARHLPPLLYLSFTSSRCHPTRPACSSTPAAERQADARPQPSENRKRRSKKKLHRVAAPSSSRPRPIGAVPWPRAKRPRSCPSTGAGPAAIIDPGSL
ncbi:hypothetical protein IWX90DRAFT_200935 [Phyllosticta citrichinensis]|uniref:Uncharacterized protein n=1 Tax=Phyllosticta citrichinensis TaxID=1130410 RepID=A0ABR1XY80_9PEZI